MQQIAIDCNVTSSFLGITPGNFITVVNFKGEFEDYYRNLKFYFQIYYCGINFS